VDFARRLAERGGRVVLQPAVQAVHDGGHSVGSLAPAQRQLYWYDNLLRYAAKHFSSIQFRMVCGAVAAGVAVRTITGIFTIPRNTPVAAFGKVAVSAAAQFLTGPPSRQSDGVAGRARRPGMFPAEG